MSEDVLKEVGEDNLVSFICPACDLIHTIRRGPGTDNPPTWIIDGDPSKPTIRPSVMVQYIKADGEDYGKHVVCHSMITDGVIQYFSDCNHQMKGERTAMRRFQ